MNKVTIVVVLDDVYTIQHVWEIAEGSMTMVSRLCFKPEDKQCWIYYGSGGSPEPGPLSLN